MSTAIEVLTGHLSVAREYAANPDEWPLAPRFDPAKRWFHRLSEEHHPAGPEVWLLSWLPGQGTEWHDHGGSAGAFFIVSGELIEHTVTRERTFAENVHQAGAGREFGPHHIHRLTNTGRRPAVSIHAYGPALKTMTRYRMQANELLVEGVDQAGVPRSEARLPIADRFDLKVIVVCQEGYTSSLAAASLQELGLSEATDLDGGFAAWKRAGLPVREVAVAANRSN